MTRWKLALILFSTALTPPAAMSAQTRDCSTDSAALARAAGTNTYRDCEVDIPAKLKNAPRADYAPPQSADCLVAKVEFVVGVDGVPDTSTALILEATDRAFAAAVVRSLPRWRYAPAQLHGEAVRQVVWERRAQEGTKKLRFTVERVGTPGEAASPVQRPTPVPGASQSNCR